VTIDDTLIKQRQSVVHAAVAEVNRLGWPLAKATHSTSQGCARQ